MAQLQRQFWCAACHEHRLFLRPGTNHLVHALATLFLCGLWLPVWIVAACCGSPWRCAHCGATPGNVSRPATFAWAVVVGLLVMVPLLLVLLAMRTPSAPPHLVPASARTNHIANQ